MALPFFGLIAIGFAAARISPLPEAGLAWLNFFIVYVALPALFFQILSKTPFDELANWRFVAITTLATACAFVAAFAAGWALTGRKLPEATIQGVLGAYSNVGYMGPGLTFAAFGPQAAVPTALIFCFDTILLFTLVPFLMALAAGGRQGLGATALLVAKRVGLHPFIIATALGVIAAYFQFVPPEPADRLLEILSGAAAPCALFAMGVTVGLRPLTRFPRELPVHLTIKLVLHPLLVFTLLSAAGIFNPVWVYTATLMAALPPALNVFVLAQQYGVYVQRASSGILVGTIASVVTVTVLLYLVHGGG